MSKIQDDDKRRHGYADGFGCHLGPTEPDATETLVWDESRVDVSIDSKTGATTHHPDYTLIVGGEQQHEFARVFKPRGTPFNDHDPYVVCDVSGEVG